MSADDDTRRVHFLGPDHLIEQADALAEVLDKDRTDIIIEALREYVAETTSEETFQQMIAQAYYDDRIDHETVVTVVGHDTARRFQLLKQDFTDEPLDIPEPDTETDIYEGNAEAVDPSDEA